MSSSSSTSSISTDGFRLGGAAFAAPALAELFFGAVFGGAALVFVAFPGADFFHLAAGTFTGSPLSFSGTWRLRGARTSSVG